MGAGSMRVNIGDLFAGRYAVELSLGRGGMGEVFLVSDTLLHGQKLALKVLHADLCQDPCHGERFLREVQLSRRIIHPNVVRTYECGQFEGQLFFTMECYSGSSLRKKLERGPLSAAETVRVLYEVTLGMQALHEAQIIHRDLKPSNIIHTAEDQIKIVDLGIAKPCSSALTRSSELIGSAIYLAPELWFNQEASKYSDIYALGIMAVELLTGAPPLSGDSPAQLMYQHLSSELPPLREINPAVPEWLEVLVGSMLMKDSSRRPESMRAVSGCIEGHVLAESTAEGSSVSGPGRAELHAAISVEGRRHQSTELQRRVISELQTRKTGLSTAKLHAALALRRFSARAWASALAVAVLLLGIGMGWYNLHPQTVAASIPDALKAPGLSVRLDAAELKLADGAPVALWPNSFSSSQAAIQQDSKRRPRFVHRSLNGQPAVSFDGQSNFLNANWITEAIRTGAGLTVVYVARSHGYQGVQNLWSSHQGDLSSNIARGGYGPNSTVYMRANEFSLSRDFFSKYTLTTEFAIYSMIFAPQHMTGFQNGREILNQPLATAIPFHKAESFALGQEWDGENPSDFFSGELAEFLLYNRVLSANEREKIELALAQQHNIRLAGPHNLPPL